MGKKSGPSLKAKKGWKFLYRLALGKKFITQSGVVGYLLKKSKTSCNVYVIEMPKSPDFQDIDTGVPDMYWYGKKTWAATTEIKEVTNGKLPTRKRRK
tara:strand:+ start:549 stop:842 length:294 start_codon:yes stop_codon:yes gene_type:complete